MKNKLQDLYDQALKSIEQNSSNPNQTPDYQLDNKQNQITVSSVQDLQIQNLLLPSQFMYNSEIYNNFALINAFYILQQKIQLVKNIYEKTENPYAVWLCDQGEWKIVIVNDKVPTRINQHNQISTFKCDYLWPIIIEKAVAKLLGASYNSFNCLITQTIESFVYLLIGQPISKLQVNTIEELQLLLDQKDSILFTEVDQDRRYIAYVINSIETEKEKKFVKLQAINQQAVFKEGIKKQGNTFLLGLKEIQLLTIYQVHLNIQYQTYTFTMKRPIERKIRFVDHSYIYTFKIENQNCQDNFYWLSICQRDQNFNSSKQQRQIKYGLIRVFIFYNLEQAYELISQHLDFAQNLFLKTELKQGEYTLLCQAQFFDFESLSEDLQKQQQTLKLQIQAIQPPKIFDQTQQNEKKLEELIISMIKKNSTIENTKNYKDQGYPNIQRYCDQIYGLLYIYYENQGETKFEENHEFILNRNLINYDTQQMETMIKLSIPPHKQLLTLYTFDPKILMNSEAISIEYEIKFVKYSYPPTSKDLLSEYMMTQKYLIQIQVDNPQFFIKHHEKGVVLLLINKIDKLIIVECQLQLQNLQFQSSNSTLSNQNMQFNLKPQIPQFIFLDIVNPKIKVYDYKIIVSVSNLQ